MKHILIVILLILSVFSCKAQSPIIALFDGSEYLETENAYYKDTNNDFNRFVGTWKYENGNQELTIILKKQQQYLVTFNNKTFYKDMMYGEYKYIDETGNTLVNTLSNIDTPITNMSEHLIFGNNIIPYKTLPECESCTPNERRLSLRLQDPERSYIRTNIVLRTVPSQTIIGVKDLELTLTSSYSIYPEGAPDEPRILEYRVYYRLIKQ